MKFSTQKPESRDIRVNSARGPSVILRTYVVISELMIYYRKLNCSLARSRDVAAVLHAQTT